MKKHLNILSHQRNTNQTYIEIPSQSSQNGSHQENKNDNFDKGTGEKGTIIYFW
jgi:hypothetical protein